MPLFNYECDEIKKKIDEVSPNYPQLTTYEKEWLFFHKYHYMPGIPVELEYETIHVNPTGSVSNAIPFNYKSAILTGNTLMNLVGEKRFYRNNGTSSILYGWEFMLPYNLTKGKTYLAVFNATGTISSTNSKVYLMDNNFNSTTGNTDYPVDFKAGYNMVKCVASGDNHRVMRIRTKGETLSDFEVSDVMLIEYQDGMENWDIPYFEGMKSVQMPVLTTTGKNLLDSNKFVGNDFITLNQDQSFTVNSNKTTQWSTLYKNLPDFNNVYIYIDIDGATSFGGSVGLFYKGASVREFASNKRSGLLIKNPFDEIRIYNAQGTNIKVRLMLSYNDETSYEPYKSNILTVNEDVELRGVGNAKDTLDLMTGELTERIGEVVLDGSEGWILSTTKDNTQVFTLTANNSKLKNIAKNGILMCDKLKIASGVDDEIISFTSTLYIALLKSKASTVEELKVYLSQNPITFIHKLATESVKTVDLTTLNKPYEGTNHYRLTYNIPCEAIIEVPVVSTGNQTLEEINS